MTEQILRIPVKWVFKDPEKFKEDAKEYFKNHRKLRPVRIGFDVGYAESLEYGTGPLRDYQPTVNGGVYTYESIYEEIYRWAGKKDSKGGILPIKNKEERKEFARTVTDRMFNYGMRPHPYWRPAINWMLDNEQVLFDQGMSLFEIADRTLRNSLKLIMDQNMPYTGVLQASAHIEEVQWSEIKDGTLYKDYDEDTRNQTFRNGGWSISKILNTKKWGDTDRTDD